MFGLVIDSVTRECTSDLCLPGCSEVQNIPGAPPGTPPATVCTYCCDGDLCNGANIRETAEQQAPPPVTGTRKCWKCDQLKTEATPGSCASDDFNGQAAQQEDCNAQCLVSNHQNLNFYLARIITASGVARAFH